MCAEKNINVALQGGGAHGAFAWGVLDAILEDGRLDIDGLTATSAGAMNASVYAYGKMVGGPQGARKALDDFWRDIASAGKIFSGLQATPLDVMFYGWSGIDQSFGFQAMEAFTRMFSPYQFNPLNINPLCKVLNRHVDFDALSECDAVKLFVCATNVKTNKIKIFDNVSLSADAVMASACLPTLFQAVEIDGEHYWDGGYMGNPALFPLFYKTKTDDILVVHINPIVRDDVPTTPEAISNRINEISFNSSLLREFRAIAFVQKMLDEGWVKEEHRSKITHDKFLMHAVRADNVMKNYKVASKFTPNWDFLQHLKKQGSKAAKQWLAENYDNIGKCSTLDLKAEYLNK